MILVVVLNKSNPVMVRFTLTLNLTSLPGSIMNFLSNSVLPTNQGQEYE
jgi:hypothetical protein